MMFFGAKSTKLSLQGWGLKDAVCDQVLYLDTIDDTRFNNNAFQHGMAISKDGLHLYFGVDSPSAIIQLSLTSPGDLTTASTTYTEKATPALADNPMRLKFNDDGTVLMVADQTGIDDNNYIYQFSLSEGWNISTLTYEKKYRYDDATYDMQTSMLDLNPDGTKMYLSFADSSTSDVILRQFSLSTGWDLGAVTIDDSIPFESAGNGIFDVEGKYLVATSGGGLIEYTFAEPWSISGEIVKDPNTYAPCTIYPYGLATSPHNGALFQLAKDPDDNYRNAITHINLPAPEDYDRFPPVADAGEDQSGVTVGNTVQLDGSGSYDTNNPPLPLYYNWTLNTRPAGSTAALSDPNIVNPTFLYDVDGDYTAGLVVSNGKKSSPSDVVNIGNAPQSTLDMVDPFADGSGISLWPFNNSADDKARINNGALTGSAKYYADGKWGQCLKTQASNTSAFAISNAPAFKTLSIWFNVLTQRNNGTIAFGGGGELLLISSNSDLYTNDSTIVTDLTENVWVHAVMTNSGAGDWDFYVNGNFIKTISGVWGDTLTLGRIGDRNTSYSQNALYDQCRIFNRSLTAEEVNVLFTETK